MLSLFVLLFNVVGGSLLDFLRKHGSKQQLNVIMKLGVDASAGMAYLEEHNCLHRY